MTRRVAFVIAALAVLASPPPFGGAAIAEDVSGPVKLAVLDDMSGPYAENSGQGNVLAVRMAIKDFGGSLLGEPIEMTSADLQNKVDVGMSMARKWFDVEGVDAILGMGSSAAALAVQKLAADKNRITLATTAATAELTGKSCSPTGAHWVYDTYALGKGAATAVVAQGGKSWYFVTADYAFGHALEASAATFVKALGGTVLGAVRHPLNTSDFSSFLLQAQNSKAQIIGVANAGNDTITALKQGAEFGIQEGGQKMVGLLMQVTEIHSLGLKATKGLQFIEAFYWDQNDETRAFSKRFWQEYKQPPTQVQAGTYSAAMHYLKAVKAAGTKEAKAVMAKMKEMPINDFMTKNGSIRDDGRVIRDMYLLATKDPSESKGEWDLMRVAATIPGKDAFRPLSESECPLVRQTK
ncbi:ABC transporter substrate-binding protein [Bradyrhizobium sp. CCBAU 51753]|uniref:ABC transporter substrate-binding protein n=1 Tax=Bradyrhizobium sp. CCBAU 51753 TaxID=1325100 RepID=UPI00188AC80E|nr:ABC transporter substrate-binding protein [Bradyrhizobium sp. CCBAU 51753]QOZ23332.1 ABC transporter permease [Bradyrhizobium sp. CCBAU 51753]